ncbi:unnamed protein product [Prunus brigantina]
MALIWRGCASIPRCVTNFMRYWRSRLNASVRFLRWSARLGALTSISSTYTSMVLPICSLKILFTSLW